MMEFPRSQIPSEVWRLANPVVATADETRVLDASGEVVKAVGLDSPSGILRAGQRVFDLLLIYLRPHVSEADKVLIQETAWRTLRPCGVIAQAAPFGVNVAHPLTRLRVSVPSSGADLILTTYQRPR